MTRILVTGGSGFIGTNLTSHLALRGHEVFSIDIRKPQKLHDNLHFYEGSIMDTATLNEVVRQTRPDCLIHLAARTDTDSDSVNDYVVNSEGTRLVALAAESSPSIKRLVHTSTQFVVRPGVDVSDPLTFDPHTAYGESKVLSERCVRDTVRETIWTIVRPTNIWGPWHPRYPQEFWRVLDKGLYLHPGGPPVRRTYGYVGNVVQQFERIALADEAIVHGQVFYLGDLPIVLEDWANAFSLAIVGRPVRHVPHTLLRAVAKTGDLLQRFGITFPLTSSRLASMTQDYVVPTDRAVQQFLPQPISMLDGVQETVSWLSDRGLLRKRHSRTAVD